MELLGNVKSYEWGKVGAESKVAQLAKLNAGDGFLIESRPYAELWMGDHVSGPSSVKVSGKSMRETLKEAPQLLNCSPGATATASAGEQFQRLPYLFKVLSINNALSIQVHPNKTQAEQLHKQFPDVYRDDNHKPELAIALTPFLALCGFREYHEIAAYLDAIPPLKDLIGADNLTELSGANPTEGLKKCFAKLMTSPEDELKRTIEGVAPLISSLRDPLVATTFAKVSKEFPGDVGILSIFFINIVELQPGEAIFLAANEPHAYLDGDCIECMACSDNVIRAGLTPKFKDVATLLEMVNYRAEPKSRKFFEPEICCDGFSKLFIPPVPDFAVKEIRIQANSTERYPLKNWRNGSITIVLQGSATLKVPEEANLPQVELKPGSVVFIPSCRAENSELTMNLSGDETFLAYQAFHNEFH